MLVLVTGANGFLGKAFLDKCSLDSGLRLRGAVRSGGSDMRAEVERVVVGDLAADTNWRDALKDVHVVVHTAARVHVMYEAAANPLGEFRRVNVDGTLSLARQAAAAGVRRFVFVSSIKVNGEHTLPGHPFSSEAVVAPFEPYGLSKHEAESGLRQLALDTGMEVVIVRPVLVYGPGVKGNFLSMMRRLHQGFPMPFGAIDNRRSLVALDNLTDLLATCLQHPSAANEVFLVSDGEDVSTAELLRRTAAALGTRARLVDIPPRLLRGAMRLVGKSDVASRLCSSLQVEIGKTQQLLGWAPPVSLDEGLQRAARWFLASRSSLHGRAPFDR